MLDKPSIIQYYDIKELNDVPELNGIFCHIIKSYDMSGYSFVVVRKDGDVSITVGDWRSNIVDPKNDDNILRYMLADYVPKIIGFMNAIKLSQAQWYFSNDLCLVDVRVSANKMMSPGMLKESMSNIVPIQETLDTRIVDSGLLRDMRSDKYDCDVIVKPNRYRSFTDSIVPLYARVSKCSL